MRLYQTPAHVRRRSLRARSQHQNLPRSQHRRCRVQHLASRLAERLLRRNKVAQEGEKEKKFADALYGTVPRKKHSRTIALIGYMRLWDTKCPLVCVKLKR